MARITDAQQGHLRRLLNEAFARRYDHKLNLDAHHLDRVTRDEASRAIDVLVKARESGWIVPSEGWKTVDQVVAELSERLARAQLGQARLRELLADASVSDADRQRYEKQLGIRARAERLVREEMAQRAAEGRRVPSESDIEGVRRLLELEPRE